MITQVTHHPNDTGVVERFRKSGTSKVSTEWSGGGGRIFRVRVFEMKSSNDAIDKTSLAHMNAAIAISIEMDTEEASDTILNVKIKIRILEFLETQVKTLLAGGKEETIVNID